MRKYLPLILLLLFTTNALALSTVEKKVGDDGGAGCDGACDYSSLNAAQIALVKDLVTSDQIMHIICYSMIDSAGNTEWNAWTTDATRYVWVSTPVSERHDGKWNTGKYVLQVDDDFDYLIEFNDDYGRFDGLQIFNTGDASAGGVVYNGGGEFHLSNCIIRGNHDTETRPLIAMGTSDLGTTNMKVWNNIMYDGYYGFLRGSGSADDILAIYNNTVYSTITGGIRVTDAVGDVDLYLKNNVVFSTADDYNLSNFTVRNYTNNMGEDDETAGQTDYILTTQTASQIFVDPSNDDFHITAGSDGYGQGVDLTPDGDSQTTFYDDIDGEFRGWFWDIGADEAAEVRVMAMPSTIVKPPAGSFMKFGHPSSEGLLGAWFVNENTGGTVWDASLNGNNGVINDATWVPGKGGPALEFANGSSSNISFPDSDDISWTDGFTLIISYAPTDIVGNQGYIFNKNTVAANGFTGVNAFLGDLTTGAFYFDPVGGAYYTLVYTTSHVIGEYATFAFVHDPAIGGFVYRNGVEIASNALSGTPDETSGTMYIGSYQDAGFYSNIKLRYALLYNRALPASEVLANSVDNFALLQQPQPFPFFVAAPLGGNIMPILRRRRQRR